jgi:hypothetical protein
MKKIKEILLLLLMVLSAHFGLAQGMQLIQEKIKQQKTLATIEAEMDEYYSDKDRGKGSGWKQYQRWLRSMEGAVDETGHLVNPSAKVMQAMHEYQDQLAQARAMSVGGAWFNLEVDTVYDGFANPLNSRKSGRINCLAFHPTNTSIIYAGSSSGGLFRSSDGGLNWTNLTSGIPSMGISAIVIDPVNPDIIYILNGDGDSNYNPCTGVLKSFDGGANWFATGLSFSFSLLRRGFAMTMSSVNNQLLVVATDDGTYRTVNGGLTWTKALSAIGLFDVEFKPGSPGVVYATSATTFYVSSDTGRTWTATPTTAYSPAKPTNTNRMQIGVSPAAPNDVYVLMGPGNGAAGTAGFSGLYKSTNSGASFNRQSNTPNILSYSSTGGPQADQSSYDLAIAVSPANSAVIYTGGINVWKSSNSGVSWDNGNNAVGCYTCSSSKYVHEDVHAIGINGSVVYVASDGGIYRSTDAGLTWSFISARMNAMEFYHVADYDNARFLLTGGTQDNGAHRYRVGYFDFMACCDAGESMINRTDSSDFIVNGSNAFLYRTTNSGANFVDVTPWYGCACNDATQSTFIVDALIQDPVSANVVYAMYRDCYKSTNGGFNWTRYVTGSTAVHKSVAVSPVNNSILYASTANSLRISTNGGVTWRNKFLPPAVSGGPVSEIAVSSTSASKLWMSIASFSSGNKVFESLDSGQTWINISGSLPNVRIFTVESVNGTSDGLYIGTDIGVFYRDDVIGDWLLFSNGLPNIMVSDLEINYVEGIITASTFGRGFWQSSLYSGCPSTLSHTTGPFQPAVNGSEYFEASNSITSTKVIDGGIGTDVVYNAGGSVQLNPGFNCIAGSTVRAFIDGCTTASPRPVSGVLIGTLKEYMGNTELVSSLTPGTPMFVAGVYPNPASDIVNVEVRSETEQKIRISVFDRAGRLVQTVTDGFLLQAGLNQFMVNLADFAQGIYQVRIESDAHQVTEKLVVL